MPKTPAQPDMPPPAAIRRRAGPGTASDGPRRGPRRGPRDGSGRGSGRGAPTGGAAPGTTHGHGDGAALCEIEYVDEPRVALARASLPPAGRIAALADLLRALGDPTRLTIVTALAAEGVEELCVCDLAELVGVSDSAMSHSLRSLRQLRVVRYRKVGKIAYYRLDDAHLARLVTEGLQHIDGE